MGHSDYRKINDRWCADNENVLLMVSLKRERKRKLKQIILMNGKM